MLLSFSLEVSARFIEGLTLYLAFSLLSQPITLVSAAFLDVGRTISDYIFFFIPYQVGSREQSTLFMMNQVMNIKPNGYLTAVFMYRFVEIVWVFIGYYWWVNEKAGKHKGI